MILDRADDLALEVLEHLCRIERGKDRQRGGEMSRGPEHKRKGALALEQVKNGDM